MKRIRFQAIAAIALVAIGSQAGAQGFPAKDKPIRIMVGFAAGGGTDIQARMMAPKFADAIGTSVVVENRPGASTMIAAQAVAQAAPDGYTILYTFNGTMAQNPHTFAKPLYDPFKDFTPISLGAVGSQILVMHKSVPATNLKELVAHAKANPGKISIASFGVGTSSHIFGELLMRQAGLDLIHVPFKGAGDAAKDLLAGRVQLMFDAAPTAMQNINTGRLMALGIVAEKRSALLPEVPTITEQGFKGIDLTGWLGFYGPANLPPEIIAKLNAALVKALANPEIKEGYARGVYEAVSSTPAELAKMTRDSHEQWGRIIRDLGIKAQ
jgi:tripartite-type tricarboxylate transporter receptor subunit TctC